MSAAERAAETLLVSSRGGDSRQEPMERVGVHSGSGPDRIQLAPHIGEALRASICGDPSPADLFHPDDRRTGASAATIREPVRC